MLAAAPMFTGLYAYSLGFTAMLATLKLLQLRRPWLAVLFAALTVGFSPLAFAFLCLIVGAYAVSRGHIARRHVWFGVGLAAAAGIEVLALVALPERGRRRLPVPLDRLRRGPRSHARSASSSPGRLAAAAPLVVVLRPVGTRQRRSSTSCRRRSGTTGRGSSAFVFPVMLLTASLAGFQPRRLVVFALAVAFAYNFVPVRVARPVAARQ